MDRVRRLNVIKINVTPVSSVNKAWFTMLRWCEHRVASVVNYPASVSVSERQRAQADAGIRKFSIRASSSVAHRASHQSDCLKASQDW